MYALKICKYIHPVSCLDADVPPLEDMSETFSNCLKIREEKKSKVQYKRNEVLEIPDDSEKFRAQQIEKLLGKETIEDKEIDVRVVFICGLINSVLISLFLHLRN